MKILDKGKIEEMKIIETKERIMNVPKGLFRVLILW
jgi:hypothetical protein